MNHIAANLPSFEQRWRQRCGDNQLRIASIVRGFNASLSGHQQRNAAKDVVEKLITHTAQQTQRSADMVREYLCGVFAASAWDQFRNDFMQLFGSMI